MLHYTLLTGIAILTLILSFTSLESGTSDGSDGLRGGVRVGGASIGSPEGDEAFTVVEASSVREVLSNQDVRAVTEVVHLERDKHGEWTVSKREVLVKKGRIKGR